MTIRNSLALLTILVSPPALAAQGISAGTADLGPVVSASPKTSGAAILDSLNGLPGLVEPATHEGTGEAIDQAQQAAEANANLSNTKAKGASNLRRVFCRHLSPHLRWRTGRTAAARYDPVAVRIPWIGAAH